MLIRPLSPSSADFHLKTSFAHIQVVGMWEFNLLTWQLWNLTTPSEPEPKPPSLFPPTDSCFQLWGTNPCAFLGFFSPHEKVTFLALKVLMILRQARSSMPRVLLHTQTLTVMSAKLIPAAVFQRLSLLLSGSSRQMARWTWLLLSSISKILFLTYLQVKTFPAPC